MILRLRLLLLILLLLVVAFAAAGSVLVVQVRQYALQQLAQSSSQTLLMVQQAGEDVEDEDGRWGIWYSQLSAAALQLGTVGLMVFPNNHVMTTEAEVLQEVPVALRGDLLQVRRTGRSLGLTWQGLQMSDGTVLFLRAPTTSAQQLTQRLIGIFGILALLTLLLAAGGAWWLVGLGLRPLEQMARQAEKLGGDDLQARLAVPQPRDEVRSLAESLNRMLGRIADTMQRLRTEEARTRAFAADASHELRTPIAAIQGSLEVLERAEDDPEARARLHTNLRRESKRAARLVADLLTLTRLDAGEALHCEPLDLAQLVADIVDTARDLAPEQELVLHLPDGLANGMNDGQTDSLTGLQPEQMRLPLLLLDRVRLEGVIWNLLRNAISATEGYQGEQRRIEVRLALQESDARTGAANGVISEATQGREVVLSVSNAADLPADFVPKLFERFSRGPNAKAGGVGLGLAIVQATIAAHGGRCFARQQGGVLEVGFALPVA